jgi:hypothetical protein
MGAGLGALVGKQGWVTEGEAMRRIDDARRRGFEIGLAVAQGAAG